MKEREDGLAEFFITNTVKEYIDDWDSSLMLLGGPMNTGKTAATVIKLFKFGYERADVLKNTRMSRFIVVGKDYDYIKETFVAELKKWLPSGDIKTAERPLRISIKRPPQTIDGTRHFGVDMEFIPVSLENFRLDDVQSMNVTGVIGVELQMVKEEIFMQIYDRSGRYPFRNKPKLLFGDFNYPDDEHWFYRAFVLKQNIEGEKLDLEELKWNMYKQPPIYTRNFAGKWEPNPDAEIPDPSPEPDLSYWHDIVLRGNTAEIVRKVQGDFVLIPKGVPVYVDSWDDSFIDGDIEPIAGTTLLFSLDPGNIPAMLVSQLANDGKLLIFAEYAPKTMQVITHGIRDYLMPILNTEIMPIVKNEQGIVKTWGWRDQADKIDSHTGLDTGLLIKREFGINIADEIPEGTFKRLVPDKHKVGTNSPEHLVRVSATMLKDRRVRIHPRCKQLISALKGKYVVDKKGDPDKGPLSHVGNAFQFKCWGVMNDTSLGVKDTSSNRIINVIQ